MSEPRKPIFGFLWRTYDGPVDEAYRQERFVRVCNRGPWRVLGLVLLTLVTVAWLGATTMAALADGVSVASVAGTAVAATMLVLVLRGWVVGTYVNDAGVRIERTWGRRHVPWTDVDRIDERAQSVPLLGAVLPVPGRRCIVRTRSGSAVPTHVYTASPDLWLRPEAYDAARLRLDRWRGE